MNSDNNNFWHQIKKPIKALAPMRGVSDVVFRQMVYDCAKPDVAFTEFVNVESFFSEGREELEDYLLTCGGDESIVVQIWGVEPEFFYKAAKEFAARDFCGIDINMGCPSPKILKKQSCAALIEDHPLSAEIIEATKEGAGDVAVSVKTRIGLDRVVTQEWFEFLLRQELDVVTVHGRTASQRYAGSTDWDEIGKVVKIRDELGFNETLIIGNGDVSSLNEIFIKAKEYSVDGVMVGRAVWNDPCFFNENKSLKDLSTSQKINLLRKHVRLFKEIYKDRRPIHILKKFFGTYIADCRGAPKLRADLMKSETAEDVLDKLRAF